MMLIAPTAIAPAIDLRQIGGSPSHRIRSERYGKHSCCRARAGQDCVLQRFPRPLPAGVAGVHLVGFAQGRSPKNSASKASMSGKMGPTV